MTDAIRQCLADEESGRRLWREGQTWNKECGRYAGNDPQYWTRQVPGENTEPDTRQEYDQSQGAGSG